MRYVLAIATAAAVFFGGMTAPTVYAAGDKAAHEMEKVSMDQLPAPVKATLEKEAKGGTIGDVTKETEKGKAVYEAHITKDGKDHYINVREDGKVVKRESARKEAKEEAKERK